MKLFLIGGFLGSGKTTAIKQACLWYIKKGKKVAVITNDQGRQLVDTGFIRTAGIPVEEVVGGCFCCNYDQLSEKIDSLSKEEKPDIIFAESVGSCTDIIATISNPLARFQPETKLVISVFADAALLSSITKGNSFFVSEDLRYIYKKQLEEADILILNKIDLLNETEKKELETIIENDYPGKKLLCQNSLNESSVQKWLEELDRFELSESRKALEIDYDQYASGEAALAWLDEEAAIYTFDNRAYKNAVKLMNALFDELVKKQYAIGHLKFFVDDGFAQQKFSYTTSSRAVNEPIYFSESNKVSLLINARVEAEPGQLKELLEKLINQLSAETNSNILIKEVTAFQPGYPKPTHRIVDSQDK